MPGEKGRLAIVSAERDVILRIFAEYAAGRSPRAIAHDLNHACIAPPRGRAWNASTLNGNGKRACGILRNRIYVGEMVWNRVRMVKDPDTGRRVSRPNPEKDWQTTRVPEMAIVPFDLFEQVQVRKAEWSAAPRSIQQRKRHLLSGLLRCGACGAGMSTKGRDKTGRIRIGCSAAIESGTCPAPLMFYLRAVERAVLSGLRRDFRHPKLLAEFVREYHDERRRLAGQATADRARIERRLAEVAREADRITDMLIRGVGNEAKLDARAKELAQEEGRLAAELEALPDTPQVVTLHPATVAYYEEALGRLEGALDACSRAGDQEPASALRDLVDKVTVWRDPEVKGGVEVEISGRLNALLGPKAYPNKVRAVGDLMVAEEGFEPPTQGL